MKKKSFLPQRDLPGWMGHLNRLDAERELEDEDPGTFLFREADPALDISTQCLSESNAVGTHPLVLSFVKGAHTIGERLVLKTDQGWILYSDDPKLCDYAVYSTLKQLFKALKTVADHPLRHTR